MFQPPYHHTPQGEGRGRGRALKLSRGIIVSTLTSTSRAAGAGRARGELGVATRPPRGTQSDDYAGETELSKLIRYGCQFELQVHQMVELSQMRAENIQLRLKVQNGSTDSGAGGRSKAP